MIVTKQKTKQEILKILEGKNRVFIIGCGDCATVCKTGGEEEALQMSFFLKSNGKEVTGIIVPDVTCVAAQAKTAFAKNREALKVSDAVLVLACGAGVQNIKENDRAGLDILPGCDSLFSALVDKDGIFREVCVSCGECILALTDGICPVARCSKGLLNGPCGGQNKGKCEVDRDRDCAWILIYNRLKEKGRLNLLKKIQPAKSHNIVKRPGLEKP